MYSMIRKVDDFMQQQNINIDKVCVKPCIFPKYVYQAMLFEVRGFYDRFFDDFSRDIVFRRDRNGLLYMVLHDVRWRKSVVILEDNRSFISVPYQVNKVTFEQDLYRNASMLRYLEKWRAKIGDMLYIPQYPFKDMSQEEAQRFRHIMEYEILKAKIKEVNADLVAQGLNIYDKVPCDEKALVRTTKNIINNIKYLNNYGKSEETSVTKK